jgi:predicted NBD/HSP70 family sugar kinase
LDSAQDASGPAAGRAAGASPGRLLALIRSGGEWTRQQLLETTGMSRPTLLARLGPLIAAGLVYETGSLAAPRGRPAQLIRFDDRSLRILAIDIGHTRARVAVTDIHGGLLRARTASADVYGGEAEDTLLPLLDTAEELLAADQSGERLVGVGVGLPAPIDPRTGLPGRMWIMPKWERYPVTQRVHDRWQMPVVLETDARALAFGEAQQHGTRTFLGVKWANGLGAGLVVDGRLLGGEDGAAGDIGHIRVVSAYEPPCRCGRHGCLAAHASGYALRRQLGLNTLDELVERYDRGDPVVARALETAAEHVGRVLAGLASMLNPGGLVLSGIIGRIPLVGEVVERELRANALSVSTATLTVFPAALGEHAVTAGLARRVSEHALAPASVDAWIGAAHAL